MDNTNPLWQDIIKFSREKNKLAFGFILLGLIGLLLPLIPGALLLAIGIMIIKPDWYEKVKTIFGRD